LKHYTDNIEIMMTGKQSLKSKWNKINQHSTKYLNFQFS
jgi:hypothetical protein